MGVSDEDDAAVAKTINKRAPSVTERLISDQPAGGDGSSKKRKKNKKTPSLMWGRGRSPLCRTQKEGGRHFKG